MTEVKMFMGKDKVEQEALEINKRKKIMTHEANRGSLQGRVHG